MIAGVIIYVVAFNYGLLFNQIIPATSEMAGHGLDSFGLKTNILAYVFLFSGLFDVILNDKYFERSSKIIIVQIWIGIAVITAIF
ncbi:MAG: hypothetical protein NWS46_07355 [Cyclobacteriaceae bacterium]|jgi:hypothetical protein|nr:hypothetical protein [Cyclobacteriaceae bacterium]